MNSLTDIGANLTHESFHDDLDDVLERATINHVDKIIVTGANIAGSLAAQKLSAKYSQLFATAGIHPHEASSFKPQDLNTLEALVYTANVVAVGECGLDFNRNYSPQNEQIKCFEAQLELACSLNKPVFMHERDAHKTFSKILEKYRTNLQQVVVHCFTGSKNELSAYLEMDCHIGITGWICDERRGHHLKDCIGEIPSNRLMLETDAPYLLPRDLKPKPKNRRNEPAFLNHIAKVVSSVLDKTPETLSHETTDTAAKFFNLD